MSAVIEHLLLHRDRLGLRALGVERGLTGIVVTPRFRASRHVVMLLLPEGADRPTLVAKLPRLSDDGDGLGREAAVLEHAHDTRRGGLLGVPRLVAFERVRERPLLVETAIAGRPLAPPDVRRDPDRAVAAALAWLESLPVGVVGPGTYERLLEQPLRRFPRLMGGDAEAAELGERTLGIVEPLRSAVLPAPLEHGDFSHPNVLRLEDGGLAAVDWELAETCGLPGHDLFFFLAYIAFARARARSTAAQVAAFEGAFLGRDPWAIPYVRRYADGLEIPYALLTPLFVACWARYAVRLLDRLALGDSAPREETSAWLRTNRYYALWRVAAERAPELEWADA